MFSFDNKLFSNVAEVCMVLKEAELKLSSFKLKVFLFDSCCFFSEYWTFCSSLFSGIIPVNSFFRLIDFFFAKSASLFLFF